MFSQTAPEEMIGAMSGPLSKISEATLAASGVSWQVLLLFVIQEVDRMAPFVSSCLLEGQRDIRDFAAAPKLSGTGFMRKE